MVLLTCATAHAINAATRTRLSRSVFVMNPASLLIYQKALETTYHYYQHAIAAQTILPSAAVHYSTALTSYLLDNTATHAQVATCHLARQQRRLLVARKLLQMIVLPSVTHLLCYLCTNLDTNLPILHLHCELIPCLHLLNTADDCLVTLPPHNSIPTCYGEQGTERVQAQGHPA